MAKLDGDLFWNTRIEAEAQEDGAAEAEADAVFKVGKAKIRAQPNAKRRRIGNGKPMLTKVQFGFATLLAAIVVCVAIPIGLIHARMGHCNCPRVDCR